MFELSTGHVITLGVLAAGQIASYAVLRQQVQDMKKKIDDECAPVSDVQACARSVEQLAETLEKHYATQLSVSAMQGKVDTITSQQSAQTATLARLESKLDAVILAHIGGQGDRRNG